MANALTLENMSPELLRVVDRAKREPEGRFHSLAHLIDVPALERAYQRQQRGRSVRRGWGHEGAIRAGSGGEPPGPARADEGEAVSPSADPDVSTSRRPRGQDAADRHLGVRGQTGPGRGARGAGGRLRAGLSGLLVRLPAQASRP